MKFNVQVNLTIISLHSLYSRNTVVDQIIQHQIFNIVLNMDNFLVNQYYDINTGKLEPVEDLTGTRASVREGFPKKN